MTAPQPVPDVEIVVPVYDEAHVLAASVRLREVRLQGRPILRTA